MHGFLDVWGVESTFPSEDRANMERVTPASAFGRDQTGYTLIELIVVLAILLVVIGAVVSVYVSTGNAQADQTARADDQQAARQALERMRRDIHCASGAIVQPSVDGSGTPTGGYTLLLTVNPGQCVGVTTSGSDGVEWCSA